MDAPDATTQVEGVGWAGRWFMRGEGGAGCWEEGGAFSSGEEARPPGGCLLRQGQEISSAPAETCFSFRGIEQPWKQNSAGEAREGAGSGSVRDEAGAKVEGFGGTATPGRFLLEWVLKEHLLLRVMGQGTAFIHTTYLADLLFPSSGSQPVLSAVPAARLPCSPGQAQPMGLVHGLGPGTCPAREVPESQAADW